MKKFHPFLLSVASGLLLAAAWPPMPTTLLIFIAFVPLFYLLEQGPSRFAFVAWSFLSMLIWNSITTWWIWNSTDVGAIGAIIANSAFMSLPWLAFYNVHKRLGAKFSYWAFLACWMTFEYIHLNWELSWPWLTLGNVFANTTNWIQWYEFTGTSGGSLWVLLANILFFRKFIQLPHASRPQLKPAGSLLLIAIGVPVAISFAVKNFTLSKKELETTNQKNTVVVQPNIDPYAKFFPGTQEQQLKQLIRLSEAAIDSQTALVVWPETAINSPNGLDEARLRQNSSLEPIWNFLSRHPNIRLLSGIEAYGFLPADTESPYARPIPGSNLKYEAYNSAALLDSSGILSRYHKSKLVPGVETLPSFLRFLDKWFEQFGGTTGGYAKQEERTVLVDQNSGLAIAPAICYESIYGDFMTGFFRNKANLMVIITNDGWWGNTAGHKQHLAYARLRAIETRRWVVRSANTGISAFIDPYGTIVQQQGWDTSATIKQQIQPLEKQTMFVRFGDWISWIMVVLAILLVSWSSIVFLTRKKTSKTTT
jgi:apolipoprotein N-acyltransferase